MNCSIFIRTYPGDYKWLKYCLQSVEKYAKGYDNVIVCYPEGAEKPDAKGVILIETPAYKNDYLGQQICKLKAYKYSNAEYIQFLDSDTLITEPVTPASFMRYGKPMILKTDYRKVGNAICWKNPTEEALGFSVSHEYMRRNFLMYKRETLKSLDLYMELLHRQKLEDYILSKDSFSEFNLLGAYAEKYEPENYVFVDTDNEIPKSLVRQFWSHQNLSECMDEINSILK